MDFVLGLRRTKANHDAIWVIIDRLTKSAHFLPINERFSLDKLVHLYLKKIVMHHGVPVSIVSDRDPRFNSRFWRQFQECLRTKLNMSTAYQPQTDGQNERTIQTIEDMLRVCAIDFKGNWDEHLLLVEFSYSNSYQASIGMPPYEALYGRKCRSPTCWDEVGERKILGPELIQQTKEKVELIRKDSKQRRIDNVNMQIQPERIWTIKKESFVSCSGLEAHLVRAAEVKKAIEWIMCNLNGHYAADSVAAAFSVGAVTAEASQETDAQISSFLSYSLQRNTAMSSSNQRRGNDTDNSLNISRNFRADVLRENMEAVFAACDAAHKKWAKILGVRTILHPKLSLQEFLSIYSITQDFITATERIGGRSGYSIRGTLQSQAIAFVDFHHKYRMDKIKAVLDQETWVEIDVNDEFQAIASSLYFEEPVNDEDMDDTLNSPAGGENETVSSNTGSVITDGRVTISAQPIDRTFSTEVSPNISAQVNISPSTEPIESNRTHITLSAPNNSASRKISFRGVGYHMVNWITSKAEKQRYRAEQR
ncbi:hypothetical protein AgCh_033276 [Apium graveolens]